MVKGNTQSKYTLVKDEIEADDNPVGFGIGAVGPVTDHDWDRIFNWIREAIRQWTGRLHRDASEQTRNRSQGRTAEGVKDDSCTLN